MKTTYSKLFLVLIATLIGNGLKANYGDEYSKSMSKDFEAGKGTSLEVANKYGMIEVENWDKPSIHIDVKITVEHRSKEEADRLLQMINIRFSTENEWVKAVTEIDKDFGTSHMWSGDRDGKRFRIDYKISAPKYINVRFTNKYGDISINEIGGLTEIDLKYGSLNINKLTRGDEKPLNAIVVGYGKATITECNWLKLSVSYSPMAWIEKCKALILISKYSKANVENASSLVVESAYDGYTLGTLSNFVLNGKYSHYQIKNVSKKIDAEIKYSGFEVETIPATFESIRIENAYGKVELGIAREASYTLNAFVKYAGIDYPDNDRISSISENTSKTVKGVVGSGKPTATVDINSAYGGIDLIK
jgi:hypothetical protein